MDIKQIDKEYIINTYNRQDVLIVSGKGATCYDEIGNKYIDFGSGIGVNSLGYCNDDWTNAVCEQAKSLQHVSNLYYTKPMAMLAKNLCEKTGYKKAFFCNSGAEANECAIKLARKYSFDKYGENLNRNKILTLKNSFHGRTITTLSATGQDVFHQYFHPFTEGFYYANANDINDVIEKLSTNDFCAVMFEFIQGEGGVIPLDKEFVKQMVDICNEKDILVIADEVQTGIGRTGKLLTSETYGVKPNITSLAKGLGGGLPIGSVIVDEKLSNVFKYGDHGTTYGGNPVVCAGANVVLNKVSDENFLSEVSKKGEYFRERLLEIDEIEGIDGIGLMMGIRLKTKKASNVLKDCIKNGLIVLTAKDKIRLLPSLTITYKEIDKGLDILEKVLTQ